MHKYPLDSVDQLDEAVSHGSFSRFATGLLIGAIAGAAVALLFAPSSGQTLRRQIRQGADKLTNRAREMYADAAAAARESSPSTPTSRRETTTAS
jgi:gas vesicle protein